MLKVYQTMKAELVCLLLLWETASCGILKKLLCVYDEKIANFYRVEGKEKILIDNGSDLDSDATTFILVPGWTESHKYDEYEDIAYALAEHGNSVVVDYQKLSMQFYGTCAYKIIETLGPYVAEFIETQTNGGYMDPSRIHLVGHSLGGQGVGVIAREVEKLTGTKVKRISSLDPAGPLFGVGIVKLPGPGLRATDAEIVDVLHTSAHVGSFASFGTVDFYANSIRGIIEMQPGCMEAMCSHKKSKAYFLESINSCGFISKKLGSSDEKVVYGLHMPLNATGIYLLQTNKEEPFAIESPECS